MDDGGSMCKICRKVFNYGPNARKHVKIHGFDLEPAAERTCPNCGKIFRYATLCKLHIKRTCLADRAITACKKCQRTFDTRQQLKTHIRSEHAVEATADTQLRCKLCDQLFSSHKNKMSHQCGSSNSIAVQSSTEPSFQCEECTKVYRTKGALKLHIESVHRGVRFPCPHCPPDSVLLSNRQALERHVRNVHEVAVCRFKCDTCGKAFKVRFL